MAEQIIAALEALEARDAGEAAMLAARGAVAEDDVIEEIVLPGAQLLPDPTDLTGHKEQVSLRTLCASFGTVWS